MNLYQIVFNHYGPKDSMSGNICLLLAESDADVFDWLASEPDVLDGTTGWGGRDDTFEEYNDKHEQISSETFRERMIRLRGEANDDEADVEDAYYGVTHYGWDLVEEDVKHKFASLVKLGLVITAVPGKDDLHALEMVDCHWVKWTSRKPDFNGSLYIAFNDKNRQDARVANGRLFVEAPHIGEIDVTDDPLIDTVFWHEEIYPTSEQWDKMNREYYGTE